MPEQGDGEAVSSATTKLSVAEIRDRLRAQIGTGAISPGAILNQAHLALELGVSRTPLREAMRMLQEEGVIVAEPNHRARVPFFSADKVETIYAERIFRVALATSLTVRKLTKDSLVQMKTEYEALLRAAELQDGELWKTVDRRFHSLHEGYHHEALNGLIKRSAEESAFISQMYWERRIPVGGEVLNWDHAAILAACLAHDVDAAVDAAVLHVARAGAMLINQASPGHGYHVVEQAVTLVTGGRARLEGLPGFGVDIGWTYSGVADHGRPGSTAIP